MSPKAKLSLLEIEQEVEAQAREWHRQQLQKRLQQVAEEQGAVCPLTGEPLQAACYEAVTLDTCAPCALRPPSQDPEVAASHPAALGTQTPSKAQPAVAGSGELHGRRNQIGRASGRDSG